MYGNYAQAEGPMAPYDMYGTMPAYGEPQGFEAPTKSPFARSQRRNANLAVIAACLLVPWTIFTAVMGVLTFEIHYTTPQLSNMVAAVCMLAVIFLGYATVLAIRRRTDGSSDQPAWYVFIFVTSLIAWIAGFVCGQKNFSQNMVPYYDVMNLNVYPSVDPSRYRGQQLMDAGRILFSPESHIDLSRSMGFRNLDTYCVAPVTVGDAQLKHYDFWAVGLNCCSGHAADFHCGEYNNPRAKSGLRLMRDDQRPYFRLAVQQAEAAYNIQAPHPIFLHWMQDPNAEINAYQDDGYKYFLLGIFGYFAFQLFAVVAAAIAFSKMYG